MITWVDLDDKKIPCCSPTWKQYGYRMITTKDEKMKPVYHCMASVSTSCLIWIYPETIGMKQCEMLKDAITSLCAQGNAGLRANLTFSSTVDTLKLPKIKTKIT